MATLKNDISITTGLMWLSVYGNPAIKMSNDCWTCSIEIELKGLGTKIKIQSEEAKSAVDAVSQCADRTKKIIGKLVF